MKLLKELFAQHSVDAKDKKLEEGLVGGVVVHNYTKSPRKLKPGQAQIHGWGPGEKPIYRVMGHDGKEVITSSEKKMKKVATEQGVAEGSESYLVYISKDRVEAFEDWMESEGLGTDVPKRDEGTYVVYDYSDANHTSKMYADEWNEKRGVAEGNSEDVVALKNLSALMSEASPLNDVSIRDMEDLDIGDIVEVVGNVEHSGKVGEIVNFGQDKRFVIVNLYGSIGKRSFHMSDVAKVEEADEDDDEEEDEDDEPMTFYVAFYDMDEEAAWIGKVSRAGSSKWKEYPFEGKPDSRWGTTYMGYLTPQQVMEWIRKDYSRGVEVEGPFFDAEEAREYAEHHFGPVSEAKNSDFDEKKIPVQAVSRAVERVLGAKGAVRFMTHLKPGERKETTWTEVNTALMSQGVKPKHIADIAVHLRPAEFKLDDSQMTPINVPLLQELDQAKLKTVDGSDAGESDIETKSQNDISFNLMRNTINTDGKVKSADVANYLEKAADLNDEVDAVLYGLETSDGQVVKVYVNATQAEAFETEMKKMLGMEDDIEEAINNLASKFDILDVIWPKDESEKETEDEVSVDDAADLGVEDDVEVVASVDNSEEGAEEEDEEDLPPPPEEVESEEENESEEEEPAEEEPAEEEPAEEEPAEEEPAEEESEEEESEEEDEEKPAEKKKSALKKLGKGLSGKSSVEESNILANDAAENNFHKLKEILCLSGQNS